MLGDTTVIGPNSGVNNVGAVSINEVAGVGNQQTNEALVTGIPGKMSVNQNSIGNFVNIRNSGSYDHRRCGFFVIVGTHAGFSGQRNWQC